MIREASAFVMVGEPISAFFEEGAHARVIRIANASHFIWRSNETQVEQEMNAFMDSLQ